MRRTELVEQLKPSNNHDDGHLVLNTPHMTWTIYFTRGQLLYVIDEKHAIRRLNRILSQHCPNWNWAIDASTLMGRQIWQLSLLDQGISQQKLGLVRAKLVIRAIVQECLFELLQAADLERNWESFSLPISRHCRSVALSTWEMQMIFARVEKLGQEWQDAGLSRLSPTVSPVLRKDIETGPLPIKPQYLDGTFTLWDIAVHLGKTPAAIANILHPSVDKGLVEFQHVVDLPLSSVQSVSVPPPTVQKPVPKTIIQPKPQVIPSNTDQVLIACIDDSPVLAYSLKKMLVPAGYRVLSIQEPMRGFSQLIEHKPSLILLDLLLPNADGYSICKFLRDTPVFENTPIIILTGQNTPIDRARARLVRATEFLAKPPRREQLLKMIQKHLALK